MINSFSGTFRGVAHIPDKRRLSWCIGISLPQRDRCFREFESQCSGRVSHVSRQSIITADHVQHGNDSRRTFTNRLSLSHKCRVSVEGSRFVCRAGSPDRPTSAALGWFLGSARNEVRDEEMADSGRVDPCVWRSSTSIRPNGPRQVSLGQRPRFQRHQHILP